MTDQPLVSIFTPTHNPRYLAESWMTVVAQTYQNFEWIIALNNGARLPDRLVKEFEDDGRVRVLDFGENTGGVGKIKHFCCREATGEIFFELDHDDLLTPDALEKTVAAFAANPDCSLVYSDTAQINADGSPNYEEWNLANGWKYEHLNFDPPRQIGGTSYKTLYRCITFEPTPHNASLIWFAPNHLRAFRAETYREAGEYNTTQPHNDDQDLMCRLYQLGDFVHIPEALYLQRMHEANTQRDPQVNANIQVMNWDLYERYLQDNLLAWTKRSGLEAIELGCGFTPTRGYTGIDLVATGKGIVNHDLSTGIPFADNSVGAVRCTDFLEHLPDKQFIMDEIFRVLAPGGMLLSLTPSTDGRGAFQDPTHVSFWNENSFWYHTDNRYMSASPQTASGLAKFQVSRVRTYFPTTWHQEHNISYVQANLIAIKPGTIRSGGELLV